MQHSLEDLIANGFTVWCRGYEDVNDHDCLRTDPMFGIAVGNLDSQHPRFSGRWKVHTQSFGAV